MGKIDNWITKIPRLKNSKVARFSYKAEAYANDNIEGVDSYDYSNDMNVPLATHTDFEGSVLSTGARANFSSIPKNGLNHFFGRVSYNLNKVIDFLSDFLDDFISFTEIVSFSSSATLSNYANGSTKRLLNTAGSTITITLPAGETYLGSNTIALAPSIMLTITKRGTIWINSSGNAITADKWKTGRNITISDADGTNTGTAVSVDGSENKTLKLPATIKATLSGNASTATEIKPLGNAVTVPAESTSVTKIIKIGTVQGFYKGTIKINLVGKDISDSIEISCTTGTIGGAKVLYSKLSSVYGAVSCTITAVSGAFDSNKDIYITVKTAPNGVCNATLGVVTSDRFMFYPYMNVVESVAGTVRDSLTLTGLKGEVSSLAHTFQKDITGNLIGNASTADKWKTARNISISDADGTNTGVAVSVDGSENETLKLPATIKANLTGNASTATKLATPRKINGVDFDGSADITVADSSISDSLIGMIAAFSSTEDFSNWLFCDGRAVSRTQYNKLFNRIGITWGAGDTTTTFNLPDLREVTLVGAGDSPRVMTDPDVFTVAQFKNATFKSHQHNYTRYDPFMTFSATIAETYWSQEPSPTTKATELSGSTVTRANSMGVGYFIRSL